MQKSVFALAVLLSIVLVVTLSVLIKKESLYLPDQAEPALKTVQLTARNIVNPCENIHEPSGVTQLADGRILIVQDEKKEPFVLAPLKQGGQLAAHVLSKKERKPAGKLSDLEGAAADSKGNIYAITSHSRKKNGRESRARQKLVRFRLDGNRITDVRLVTNLKPFFLALDERLAAAGEVLDVKRENGFNIEALAVHHHSGALMIGLRGPVIDGKAAVLLLQNPAAVFDAFADPVFADVPVLLNLGGGGLRAMAYDAQLKGYVLISGDGGRGLPFRLWWWSGVAGQSPRLVALRQGMDLENAEGITPVYVQGQHKLLLVFDQGRVRDGEKKACYRFLTDTQLQISPSL